MFSGKQMFAVYSNSEQDQGLVFGASAKDRSYYRYLLKNPNKQTSQEKCAYTNAQITMIRKPGV